ncbi:polyprenol phosphomannose-dependent alpha 1,6 mannosyltransferase MptB [Patescibacteria group bacterium]|nr:polyprenol phosphomannose-dependent alpha 1,6 mannosyltransferase MptB [Patescibacteria group bacterium]
MNTNISNQSSQTTSGNIGIRAPVFLYVFGIVFAVFFFAFSLMVIVYSPTNIGELMRHTGVFFAELSVVGPFLFALFGVYVLFYIYGKEYLREKSAFRVVIYFTAVFAVILILTPPFFSSDLYGYTSRASIANLHDVTQYSATPAELGYQDVVAWENGVTPYGPFFTLYSTTINKVIGQNVIVNLVVFRLVAIAVLAASIFLIYKIASQTVPRNKYFVTALFAWNPFILIESIHSAHNDVFMVFFILLSIYLILKSRFIWAAGSLTLGFLVKFSPIILLPIVFLFIIKQSIPVKRKIRDVVLAILLIVVLVVVFYLPYQNFSDNLGNLGNSLIGPSNLTFPQFIINVGFSFLDKYTTFEPDIVTLRAGYLAVFLALYIFILFYKDLTKNSNFIIRYFLALLSLLFLLGGKFNIWYILWFIPLVLLVDSAKFRHLILFITAYGFLYYAMLSVFIPNALFCAAVGIYYVIVRKNSNKKSKILLSSNP